MATRRQTPSKTARPAVPAPVSTDYVAERQALLLRLKALLSEAPAEWDLLMAEFYGTDEAELEAWIQASAADFQKIWDNPSDAIYDTL